MTTAEFLDAVCALVPNRTVYAHPIIRRGVSHGKVEPVGITWHVYAVMTATEKSIAIEEGTPEDALIVLRQELGIPSTDPRPVSEIGEPPASGEKAA